jgi:DUF917 family protein
MPNKVIRTEQEVADLLRGLVMLGTGGGGHPKVGGKYLLDHIKAGHEIKWTDIDDVPDDAWTCCVFGMGSVAPHDPLSDAEREALGYVGERFEQPMVEALLELEEYAGVTVQALVSFEPGAVATSGTLDVATRLGKIVIDADNCGRAVPKLSQTLAALSGYTLWPAAICDTWGNRMILKSSPSAEVAETLGKMISVVAKRPDAFAICAHAGFLVRAGELKANLIPGTLTRALEIGSAIRSAVETQQDPLAAATKALDGWLLFKGTITSWKWESRDGYMFGTTFIQGDDEFAGHTFKIWVQNENHISWLDDEVFVTSPDLIMVVDKETGEPFVNTVLSEGQSVAILGAKINDHYRTPKGLEAMGPGHYGFVVPYRPIETLVANR